MGQVGQDSPPGNQRHGWDLVPTESQGGDERLQLGSLVGIQGKGQGAGSSGTGVPGQDLACVVRGGFQGGLMEKSKGYRLTGGVNLHGEMQGTAGQTK